jgi:hypothetical protein
MTVTTKQIAIISSRSGEATLLTVQDYGVEAHLTAVRVGLDESQLMEMLSSVAQKLQGLLTDECTAIYHEACKTGHGETLLAFLDALDTDSSTKIPNVFRGELRKRLGQVCAKMRSITMDPKSGLKASLTKTTQGYFLEMWYLEENLTVYKDLVEPVYDEIEWVEESALAVDPVVEVVAEAVPLVPVTTPVLTASQEPFKIEMHEPEDLADAEDFDEVPLHAMTTREATRRLATRVGFRFF